MAALMSGLGRYEKLCKVISGFRKLAISSCPACNVQPIISTRSLWNRSAFDKDFDGVSQAKRPVKPRRPAPVFVLYLTTVQNEVARKNPTFDRRELISHIAGMWRELDPEEKAKIGLMKAEKEKQYKENMKVYMDNVTPEQIKEEADLKRKKARRKLRSLRHSLNMPKFPPNPFGLYVQDMFRHRDKDTPVKEYFKHCSEEWSKTSLEEKEKYKSRIHSLKAQYFEDMEKWEEQMIKAGHLDVIRNETLTEMTKDQSLPKKRKPKAGRKSLKEEEDDFL